MTITIDGVREIKLPQRVAMIVLHAIDMQAEIEAIPVGKFCVDFSGRGTQPFLTRVYRSAKLGQKKG